MMSKLSILLLVVLFSLCLAPANQLTLQRRQDNGGNNANTNNGGNTGGNGNSTNTNNGSTNSTNSSNGSGQIDPNDPTVIDGGKSEGTNSGSSSGQIGSVNWIYPNIQQSNPAKDIPVIPAGSNPPFNISWNLTGVRQSPKSLTLEFKRDGDKSINAWTQIDNKISPNATNYIWFVPGGVPEAKDYRLRMYDSDLGPNNIKVGTLRAGLSGKFYIYKPRDLSVPVDLPQLSGASVSVHQLLSGISGMGWAVILGYSVVIAGVL